ncbi:hypothetical protein Bbelb_093460 [Branchiostoma belcheri]|nr:hypothetical protein Bbelb_093460 [Branchiostoma belcheri]
MARRGFPVIHVSCGSARQVYCPGHLRRFRPLQPYCGPRLNKLISAIFRLERGLRGRAVPFCADESGGVEGEFVRRRRDCPEHRPCTGLSTVHGFTVDSPGYSLSGKQSIRKKLRPSHICLTEGCCCSFSSSVNDPRCLVEARIPPESRPAASHAFITPRDVTTTSEPVGHTSLPNTRTLRGDHTSKPGRLANSAELERQSHAIPLPKIGSFKTCFKATPLTKLNSFHRRSRLVNPGNDTEPAIQGSPSRLSSPPSGSVVGNPGATSSHNTRLYGLSAPALISPRRRKLERFGAHNNPGMEGHSVPWT